MKMVIDRAIVEQALKVLETYQQKMLAEAGCRWIGGDAAITALHAALAQQDEPVQEPEGMVEFLADLQRSRTKYPKNRRMFDGLMGEIDELRRAYAGDGDIRAEAFDVAVCAFRIATEGDAGGNARLEQAESDHETRAELAEQQVVQLAEERDHYRNLWQKAQQAEPVEPVAWRVNVGGTWFHARDREALMSALVVVLGCSLNGIQPEPLYTAPPQRPAEPVQEPAAWRFKPMIGSPWALSDDGYYISCKRDQGYIVEALGVIPTKTN